MRQRRLNIFWLVLLSAGLTLATTSALAASPSQAAPVIGTFNSTRAWSANVATGNLTQQARSSIAQNFPGSRLATTATLTPGFLANIDLLLISNLKTEEVTNYLSASEQSALFDFVRGGGSAFLIADGYFSASAQSLISPFGMNMERSGLDGSWPIRPSEPSHPVFDGPFGKTTHLTTYYPGAFTNLGPYATSVGYLPANNMLAIAVIEANVLGPGSGRVVIVPDGHSFMDANDGGFFPESEAFFLNTIHYLVVPEPSSWVLGVMATGVLWFAKRRTGLRGGAGR